MDFSGIVDFFKFLLNSEEIIQYGGLALIVLIVYAENGLFFAFFLPGDYLLFLAGLFASSGQLNFPISTVSSSIVGAAILGSYTGYFFGKLLGKNLDNRKDSLFFKKRYMEQSRTFFAKYGGKALVLRTFTLYNVAGALAWGVSLPVAGYYLGERFPAIINYVEYIILFFISITTIALIRTFIQMRRSRTGNRKVL
jgi:membrane-associated protein